MWGLIGEQCWVRDLGLFTSEQQGKSALESLFIRDKGRQEQAVISTWGLFVLVLNKLYGLTSNFSCPVACLRQSSCHYHFINSCKCWNFFSHKPWPIKYLLYLSKDIHFPPLPLF
jgi:hypothetical protein